MSRNSDSPTCCKTKLAGGSITSDHKELLNNVTAHFLRILSNFVSTSLGFSATSVHLPVDYFRKQPLFDEVKVSLRFVVAIVAVVIVVCGQSC